MLPRKRISFCDLATPCQLHCNINILTTGTPLVYHESIEYTQSMLWHTCIFSNKTELVCGNHKSWTFTVARLQSILFLIMQSQAGGYHSAHQIAALQKSNTPHSNLYGQKIIKFSNLCLGKFIVAIIGCQKTINFPCFVTRQKAMFLWSDVDSPFSFVKLNKM